ncbi:hypothetical protein [Arthrobacter sp. JSM 101049]|uniref:hypothetical protein n=1 Tax=Arthrobacter sp. JSM 101049 TaxID=929097 RepID=UPI003566C6D7
MSTMTVSIEHNGKTYTGQPATIKGTALQFEDHGIFTAWLHLEWKGGGIGVGGYCLDTPEKDDNGKFARRVGTGYGADHIMRVIETVGASSWEKLPGREVFVLFEGKSLWGSTAAGLAGVTNEKVLILKEHAESWSEKEGR